MYDIIHAVGYSKWIKYWGIKITLIFRLINRIDRGLCLSINASSNIYDEHCACWWSKMDCCYCGHQEYPHKKEYNYSTISRVERHINRKTNDLNDGICYSQIRKGTDCNTVSDIENEVGHCECWWNKSSKYCHFCGWQ